MQKIFRWNIDKNEILKQQRNVSFEMVIEAIKYGNLIDIIEHPNKEKYSNQQIFIVNLKSYIYIVPFVEDEQEVFLKAIIPSRLLTKKYLKK